jgi:hypothetical protein
LNDDFIGPLPARACFFSGLEGANVWFSSTGASGTPMIARAVAHRLPMSNSEPEDRKKPRAGRAMLEKLSMLMCFWVRAPYADNALGEDHDLRLQTPA